MQLLVFMGHFPLVSFPFLPEGGREVQFKFLPIFRRNFLFKKSKTNNSCNLELLTFRNTDLIQLLEILLNSD